MSPASFHALAFELVPSTFENQESFLWPPHRICEMDWDSGYIKRVIEQALEEDLTLGDLNRASVPSHFRVQAHIIAKQELVCAGLPLAVQILRKLDPQIEVELRASEGQWVHEGLELIHLTGKAAAILTGERPVVNFLARLSGIATLTYRYREQLAGGRTRIRATEKSTPGLQRIEQYAVEMGGGTSYRSSPYGVIVVTENHIAVAGGVKAAMDQAHSYAALRMLPRATTPYEAVGALPALENPLLSIQVVVRNESELREALDAGGESLRLMNMLPEQARHCTEVARSLRPDCVVEISGDIDLGNVHDYVKAAADYISPEGLILAAPPAEVRQLVDSVEEK